jgi:hypothetical protein
VNATLVVAFWRQRLTSPIRLALLLAAFGFPLLGVVVAHGSLSMLGDSAGLTLIFAVGMIGQDVSSGVLQLLFARPVRRMEYVASRWFAVGAAASIVGALQIALSLMALAARGGAPPAQDAALFVLQRVLESFGLAAVFALLSTLIGSVGDLALYALGTITTGLVEWGAQMQGWTLLARVTGELQGFLTPKLPLAQLIAGSPIPLFPFVSYLSTVTLCLALAVLVMNRKELSYASG